MPLSRYAPPGNLDDLDADGQQQWSDFISRFVDAVIEGNSGHTNDSPRAQFYNLTKVDTAPDAQEQDISWIAFPRQIAIRSVSDVQRWTRADSSRDLQDEYCEWSVTRNEERKITRVTFTCEAPEYWEFLAQLAPDTLVALYQQHISPKVAHGDLFDASGAYIRKNRWNSTTTDGAMHLVQGANTLTAEIELAAAGTIRRVINGQELTGEQELIACSQFGVADRNSDPHIGGSVNALARLKADISLADPVGLYFDDLNTSGWLAPDESDPKSFWTVERGTKDNPVRMVYEVPADRGFVVGDITIEGKPITFASQLTDFITMKLTGVACRIGESKVEPMTECVGPARGPGGVKMMDVGASTVLASRA